MFNAFMGTGIAAIASVAGAATPDETGKQQQAVQKALDASAAAWTAGDLDAFMTLYEDGPHTTYVSGGNIVKGYRAIRDMYAARFQSGPDAKMGRLSLETLDFRLLDPDHAFVLGRYHLFRGNPETEVSGLTTLLFHRGPHGWRLVSDHTG